MHTVDEEEEEEEEEEEHRVEVSLLFVCDEMR